MFEWVKATRYMFYFSRKDFKMEDGEEVGLVVQHVSISVWATERHSVAKVQKQNSEISKDI